MRKLLVLVLVLLFIFSLPVLAETKTPIKIVSISDGDSLKAQIDKNEFRVRLVDIDCYETCKIHRAYRQAYDNGITIDEVVKRGNESKQYLLDLYLKNNKKNVFLEFRGIDKYGRALGILYFGTMNVNEEMKKHGGCMVYEFK